MLAAVGFYGLFCGVSVVEEFARGESLSWDWWPFYMFVVPTSVFAITIYLSSRRQPSSEPILREIDRGSSG
jgi:hypothetical protein